MSIKEMVIRNLKSEMDSAVSSSTNKKMSICKLNASNKKDTCSQSLKRNFKKDNGNKEPVPQVDRNKFIRKYAYLVNWVVSRLPLNSLKGMERDDLVGYGTIGLIEAVDRFDTSRNTNFESFAIARIRGSIYDQLRAADWLSRGSRKRVKNLFKASATLENKLGRYPTNAELAEELLITPQELRLIQQEAQIGIYSLDEPRDNSEESISVAETISSNCIPLLEKLEENELKDRLTKAVDTLPEKEKIVIGLYHYKKLTFKEIAEVMKFSESRASQIHARAISLLKAKMLKD